MKSKNNPLLQVHTAAFVVIVFAMSSAANAQTWDGDTGVSWGSAGNWSATPGFTTTSDLSFPTSAVMNFNTILGGSNRIARSLIFGAAVDTAFSVAFTTSPAVARTLTMDTDAIGGNATITVISGAAGDINLGNPGALGSGTGDLILADNLVVDHNGSGLLLFSENINGTGFGITKNGGGTMQTALQNNFTGNITVNAGRYIVSSTSADLDLDNSPTVTLGGGILEVRTGSAVSKNFNTAALNVTSASAMAYNNTTAGNQSMTLSTAAMTLGANLTLQNISAATSLNVIDITRQITGNGNLIVETFNALDDIGDSFSLGRVQLYADNSGWNGNLIVSKGTVQIAADPLMNSIGNGTITLGTTGDPLGAGLSFNVGSDISVGNHIVVATGGFRGIKNNGSGALDIALNGNIALDGNLAVDHSLNSSRIFTLAGNITGGGNLGVSRIGGTGDGLRLTGNNSYTGTTTINAGAILRVLSTTHLNGIGDTSAVSMTGAGSTLVIESTSETIGSLASTATDGSLVLNGNLTTGGNNANTTYGGTSSGLFGLTKVGNGIMETTNVNGFTGALAINGGGLIVSANDNGGDLNNASAVNFGGGTLEIKVDSSNAKTFSKNFNVTTNSVLAYNNTTATTRTLTLEMGALVLDANLTLQNISSDTSLNNLINISRNMTGNGNLIVETYNTDIDATGDNFSPGRVQLLGNNSLWNGNLVIAKGTAQLAGVTSEGNGSITIGTTSNMFGAGLAFNRSVDINLDNNFTIATGGFRAIKNIGSGTINIVLAGSITLDGDLSVDHTLGSGQVFDLEGDISGSGNLTITREGFGTNSVARMTGTNTYTGNTTVNSAAGLVVDGSLTSPNISVATTGRFGGDGSTTGNLSLSAGAKLVFSHTSTFDVSSTLSLDSSFGVASLVTADNEAIDWALIPAGTYTLIGTTASSSSNISNFGVDNAADVGSGRTAYFQGTTGLHLVVTAPSANPYDTWSDGAAFNVDSNNDGLDNGLAWFLGAADKNVNATGLLPKATENAGALVLQFDCLNSADRGMAIFTVEHSSDLGQIDEWAGTEVPGVEGTFTAGVVDFVVTDPLPLGVGKLKVVATIPVSEASAGKLFGRVNGQP